MKNCVHLEKISESDRYRIYAELEELSYQVKQDDVKLISADILGCTLSFDFEHGEFFIEK